VGACIVQELVERLFTKINSMMKILLFLKDINCTLLGH